MLRIFVSNVRTKLMRKIYIKVLLDFLVGPAMFFVTG